MKHEFALSRTSPNEDIPNRLGKSLHGASPRERWEQSTKDFFVSAMDGTRLYVQDWGSGRPVVFVAAWTFDSAVWGSHIAALAPRGFRCLAADRRGHGRSDAPCHGYDLDTLATDLGCLMEQNDLRDVVLIAHSMGSIEAVRYCASLANDRVSRLVLISATTPYLIRTPDNPDAVPREMVDADAWNGFGLSQMDC